MNKFDAIVKEVMADKGYKNEEEKVQVAMDLTWQMEYMSPESLLKVLISLSNP